MQEAEEDRDVQARGCGNSCARHRTGASDCLARKFLRAGRPGLLAWLHNLPGMDSSELGNSGRPAGPGQGPFLIWREAFSEFSCFIFSAVFSLSFLHSTRLKPRRAPLGEVACGHNRVAGWVAEPFPLLGTDCESLNSHRTMATDTWLA